MFDNQKIRLIEALPEGDTILVIWIKLLTYAGKTNANGFILINEDIALSVEEMAIVFSRPLNVVRLALQAFKRYGMISLHDEIIRIKNWDVYQNVEGMEKAKQLNAERNRKYRERKKLEIPTFDEHRDVSVTSRDATDIDIELELDKEKDINNKELSEKPSVETQFEEWWTIYNKKKAKPNALKSFVKVVKKHGYDVLRDKTKLYCSGFDSDDTFKQYPATFLNNFDPDNDYTPKKKGGQTYGTNGHKNGRDITEAAKDFDLPF